MNKRLNRIERAARDAATAHTLADLSASSRNRVSSYYRRRARRAGRRALNRDLRASCEHATARFHA